MKCCKVGGGSQSKHWDHWAKRRGWVCKLEVKKQNANLVTEELGRKRGGSHWKNKFGKKNSTTKKVLSKRNFTRQVPWGRPFGGKGKWVGEKGKNTNNGGKKGEFKFNDNQKNRCKRKAEFLRLANRPDVKKKEQQNTMILVLEKNLENCEGLY